MVIANNISAVNTSRNLNLVVSNRDKTIKRLSSGYRINSSADDAAGLMISESMRYQIRGLNKASQNIQDGISFIQVADGALTETHSILQRMRELSVQAANDTCTLQDRSALQAEINQLGEEIDKVATDTTYNGSIHPLLGDLHSEYQLPMSLATTTQTINASAGSVVDGVTQLTDARKSVRFVVYTGSRLPSGTVYAEITRDGIELNDGKSATKTLASGESWTSLTLSSFNVDSEGYLYFDDSGSRNYIQLYSGKGDMELVSGPNRQCMKADRVGLDSGIKDGKMWIQTGALKEQGVQLSLVNATTEGIGLQGISVMSFADAGSSIATIDKSIAKVSKYRSEFGASQNALEHMKRLDDTASENTSSAESKLRDADYAQEMLSYSTANILAQAGQAMLAQANNDAENILKIVAQ